ncbi:MAG TPA: nucleotidyl transferase AbiEii/AbiGii toxin family protein [Burkholderiaceae bacterium]|nr:nucleotidyl transferase AbiEii/AbiGii toxin family protein [Burkholderiaceae bacterium]
MSAPQDPRAQRAKSTSIHDRLLNRAKKGGEDFNQLLTRYATERFLYRMSVSRLRDQFLLKGALLFDLWFHQPHRPTRDADFLGFGSTDAEAIAATIGSICTIDADDGMNFDATTIAVAEIREDANYGGLRVKLLGLLGTSRCTLQLDVAFGDVVIPGPLEAELPTILDGMAAPRLRVYPRETVVAEKLEAIANLGMANSRMKDYFDLRALLREDVLDQVALAESIAATFRRRGTSLPPGLPIGLTAEFGGDELKRKQWAAFLKKNRLEGPVLDDVVVELAAGLSGPLSRALKIAGGDRTT